MQIQITNSNITLLDRWSARFTEASNGCWNWIGPLQQPQRNRYAAGVSMYSLAKEYGVSGTTVANVIRGKIWKLGDPIMVKG